MTSAAEKNAADQRLILVNTALKAYENFPQEKIVFQVSAQKLFFSLVCTGTQNTKSIVPVC